MIFYTWRAHTAPDDRQPHMGTMQSPGNQMTYRAASLLCAAVMIIACVGCGETPESLEREAKGYLAKGDRVSAAIQYKSLLALDPGRAEAHFQLGKILAEIGRPEAEASLRRALDAGKPAGDVIPVLGRVLLDLEKYKELLVLLEPDPKRSQPTDPKVLAEFALLRGYAYLGQRDFTSANTQFQLATIALPEKAKLAAASLAAARNERAEAETLINDVLASNPGNADAHLALGELRRTANELEKALPHFAEAAKLDPNNVNTLLIYGIGLINADRVAEARPLIEQAKKLAPPGPVLYFAQALIECKEQHYQQCAEFLDKVFDISPQYMPGLLLSGQLNYATGNFEQSLDALVHYLKRAPADPHARKLLAGTLLAQSNAQAALNVLQPLLGTSTNDAQLLGLSGQAMLQLGNVSQASESLEKAVQLVPDNPEFRTALALTHLASGMRRRAEADFRAAIALKPPNSKADYGLIMMLLGENRIEQAREAVAEVEQRLPVKPETHMLKGVVLRTAGDVGGARKAFERAAELDANYFPAVQELADMDIEGGKESAGRARIEAVLRRNGTHVDALLTMARLEFSAGRRVEGLAWARRAADAHPESNKALLLVVEAQTDAGELNDATQSARQALKLWPRDPRALKALGNVQLAAKDYPGAAATFSTLVSIQPGSIEAHLLLASAYVMAGDIKTAIYVARNALKRNPRSLKAMTLVGDMLLEGKEYPEALDFARLVQRENPKLPLGYRLEGEALLAQGDARRAVKGFETGVKLVPSGFMLTRLYSAMSVADPGSEREAPLEEWLRNNPEDSATRTFLAEALATKGRHKEAIAQYMELVRRYPSDARTLNNLAWSLHFVGDAQAVVYAERAYKLKPAEAPVLDTYGWILVNHGKLQEGIQILLQAVALDGKNPEIRYHLAKGLVQTGDKTRARAELKSILSTGKPFAQIDEARALLASLGS
jgi:putative PEP-CTERM system TPR-repeat lipoprotein